MSVDVRYLVAADSEMVVGEGASLFTISYRLTRAKVEYGLRNSWLPALDLNLKVARHNQRFSWFACPHDPLYRNLAFLDVHGCISVWDLDHIGDFANKLDTEAFHGRSGNEVIDEASNDGNCLVPVLGMTEYEG